MIQMPMRAREAPDADEESLYVGLTAGQPRAERQAWDRLSPLVRSLLRRVFGPGEDVEDLVQDVFVQLFGALPRLKDRQKLRSFLYSLTMNVAKGELRRRRIRQIVSLTATGDLPSVGAAGAATDAALLHRFYRLLGTLTVEERLAFVLRHVVGLPTEEIAVALGRSLATVKRRLERAMRRLTERMQQDPELRRFAPGEEADR